MRLSEEEIEQSLRQLPGWAYIDGELTKRYELPTFLDAIRFVNEVARLAEEQNHHPDIRISYRRVTLQWVTHDQGGVTEIDVRLAKECDALG